MRQPTLGPHFILGQARSAARRRLTLTLGRANLNRANRRSTKLINSSAHRFLLVPIQVREVPRSVTRTSNSNERTAQFHDAPGMKQRIPSLQLLPLRVARTRLRAAVLRRAIRSPRCGDRATQDPTARMTGSAVCTTVRLWADTSVQCSRPGTQVQRVVLAARPNPSTRTPPQVKRAELVFGCLAVPPWIAAV